MARHLSHLEIEDTRERVLRAAEDIFGKTGYRDARLEDIAFAAGIRRPTVLYHFRSKQDLYEAVVGRAFSQLQLAIAEALEVQGTFAERLDALGTGLMTVTHERRGIFGVILRELLDPHGGGLSAALPALRQTLDAMETFIRLGSDAAPDVPVRDAVLHLAMGHLVRSVAHPSVAALWTEQDTDIRKLGAKLFVLEAKRREPHAQA